MAQHIDSRTIHTIRIDLQDDILGKIEQGDEVEVVLMTRSGGITNAKKLTYRDLDSLLTDHYAPHTKGFRPKSAG